MGFENLVTYDQDLKQYFTTREFEETSPFMDFIEEFENDTFWDELIERLVERDLIRQEGEEKVFNMTPQERFRKEEPLQEMYSTELEVNGLDNIRIDVSSYCT